MVPTSPPSVVSASRRTDLVSCFPEYLMEKLTQYPPGQVHSLVIWTKNPRNMLAPGLLRETLSAYRQLFVHLTITGLGGSLLEPNIPPWQETAAMLPAMVDMVGDAQRVSWRFDPIIKAEVKGEVIDNFGRFSGIAEKAAAAGITTCRTSWVEPYRKVERRTAKKGVTLQVHAPTERLDMATRLQETAGRYGIRMQYCSMEGFPRSRCIDGRLLTELHPDGLVCSTRRAGGQRKLCGCTESIDIGWYSLKCRNGCLYCYAEPLID